MWSFLQNLFKRNKQPSAIYGFVEIYNHIGYYPKHSEENYIKALTHSSYTKKATEKNERLEFLGDAVISFVVAEVLFQRLEGKDEGVLTKARASIVNRKNLNKIGTEIGIPKYVRHKLSDKQMLESPDIIGNAFEAFIGAFFLDYGMHESEVLVSNLLMKDFHPETFHNTISDYKSFMLEWIQARKKTILFSHNSTPDANGVFTVVLKIDGEDIATGSGKNKKEAEQDVCIKAVQLLKLE
ncbi:MAG: ribonuclease III [Chitinophagales bacterium]